MDVPEDEVVVEPTVGDSVYSSALLMFMDATRISDGEDVEVTIPDGVSLNIVAIGDGKEADKDCLQVEWNGFHIWLGPEHYEKQTRKLTMVELGNIMLKAVGPERCQRGYQTVDPAMVGMCALSYGDINANGTTN